MPPEPEKINFRLVLMGSVGTGKTSILNRFLFNKYVEKYQPTVEDLFTKDFDLGTIMLRVDFLDTSGTMQFPAMRRLSITTGGAFLIVYSFDDLSSFQIAKQCIGEIQESRSDYQEIPIIIVGNKCDIPAENRKVRKQDIINYVFCELPKMRLKVMECSSKDNINVTEIFKTYLALARISISTISTEGGLKRRSSAHASGKWRFGNIVGNSTDNSNRDNKNSNSTTKNTANNNSNNSSTNTSTNTNANTNTNTNPTTTTTTTTYSNNNNNNNNNNKNSNNNNTNNNDNNNNNNNNTNNNNNRGSSNGKTNSNGGKTSSNCSKTTVALIKSVTGNTLNRVGRTLTGGTNNGASCSGTQSNSNSITGNNNNNKSGKQSPMISASQDNLTSGEEDSSGQNSQQNVVIATKSQPISAHLALDQRSKPRSRSLMRRSTRKSKVQDNEDVSQCLPS